jgi:hypothetical protein
VKGAAKVRMDGQSSCDYCGCLLPALDAQTQHGLHACDPCLASNCDDQFPKWVDPRFAASARYRRGIDFAKIEDLLAEAGSRVASWQLERLRQALTRANDLYLGGREFAALEAAQACWESANGLFDSMATRPAVQVGEKVRAGGRKGGATSRQVRSGANSKRALVLEELAKYQGQESAKVATVARRASATPRYVRMILAAGKEEK